MPQPQAYGQRSRVDQRGRCTSSNTSKIPNEIEYPRLECRPCFFNDFVLFLLTAQAVSDPEGNDGIRCPANIVNEHSYNGVQYIYIIGVIMLRISICNCRD